MMMSKELHVRVRGRRALFTRPEYRTERMSNVTNSHAGWESILCQVIGHKGCRYQIERVAFLFQPRFFTITANELQSFGSGRKPLDTESQGTRTLRTSTVLAGKKRRIVHEEREQEVSGVDFVVSFRLLTPEDKYLDMLLNRLRNGNYYGTQPYLGVREFPCRLDRVEDFRSLSYPLNIPDMIQHPDGLKTVNYSERLGICFFGTDWDDPPSHPNYFATLEVKGGIIQYPTWAEVRKFGYKRDNAA